MLLKSFFFTLYTLIGNFSFYLLCLIVFFSFLVLFSDLRKKFALFLLIVIIYSIWGFLLDLDGIFLVFITAEFTIFLLFLMTYLQLYSNYSFVSSHINLLPVIFFIFGVIAVHNSTNTFHFFTSYYKSINHVVSSDFYILYYFLFEKLPILVIVLTLVISFFSLFFIIMYFSLKLVKLGGQKRIKNLYFLRKQILTKQTVLLSKVYTFQN